VFLDILAFQAFYYIYIYIYDKGHRQSSVYFMLARDDVGVVEPGEFVEA
jgi:hypothetical protein